MSLHDGVFMLRQCSTHCKLFEMILTSSDPRSLKRKKLEKDKLYEEGSRLAWMDLEALVVARTKGCIEMSEIIILVLLLLNIQVLIPLPSVWEQRGGHPSAQESEKKKCRESRTDSSLLFPALIKLIWSKWRFCLNLDSNNIIVLVTAT